MAMPQLNLSMWIKVAIEAYRKEVARNPDSDAVKKLHELSNQTSFSKHLKQEASTAARGQLKVFLEAIISYNERLSQIRRLKKVLLPGSYDYAFTKQAFNNTIHGIETMGILFGNRTPYENYCIVTTILIPEQNGTGTTCGMVDETALLQFAEENDVQVLGWIHTHPNHFCFMSCIDLHTQAVWQKMIPETLAIVCANGSEERPAFTDVFRLTDLGLDTILNCRMGANNFHSHFPEDKFLYMPLNKTFAEDADLPLRIVDVRKKENLIALYPKGWRIGVEIETKISKKRPNNEEVNLTPSGAPPGVAVVENGSEVHGREMENPEPIDPEPIESFSDNANLTNLPPTVPATSKIAVVGRPLTGPIRTQHKRWRPWAI